MSLIDSLAASLDAMGSLQLAIAMLTTIAYAVMLNASFAPQSRGVAGALSFLGAGVFSALMPSWMSGIVLMALAVAAFAVFAGVALLLSEMFGLGLARGRLASPIAAHARLRAAPAAMAPLRRRAAANSL